MKFLSKSSKDIIKIKHFKNQDFNLIVRILLKTNLLFEDDMFPMELPQPYNKNTKWIRPTEIVSKPILLESSNCNGNFHVQQGVLTPEWFPALLTALRYHKLNNKILINQPRTKGYSCPNSSYMGIYQFQLFFNGTWNYVVIDDKLPIYREEKLFTQSSNSNEFWEPLVEKLLAKILGGYAALKNMNFIDTATLLTCGAVGKFDIINVKTSKIEKENFKNFLEEFLSYNGIIIAKLSTTKDLSNCIVDHNLNSPFYIMNKISMAPKKLPFISINKLAASIAIHSKSTDLISLRDPSQIQTWHGSFNNLSKEWDHISTDAILRYDLSIASNNEFWMPIEDFYNLFQEAYVIFSEFLYTWNRTLIHDTWNLTSNVLSNKQYILNVKDKEGDTIVLLLSKICNSMSTLDNVYLNLDFGLNFLKVEKNRQYRLQSMNDIENVITIFRSTTKLNVVFAATLKQGAYIINPWIKGVKKPYLYYLKIFSIIQNEISDVRLLKYNAPSLISLQCCLRCQAMIVTRVFLKEAILPSDNYFPTIALIECEKLSLSAERLLKPPYIWNESFIFYRKNPKNESIIIRLVNDYDIISIPDNIIGFCSIDSTDVQDNDIKNIYLWNIINGVKVLTEIKIVIQIFNYNFSNFTES